MPLSTCRWGESNAGGVDSVCQDILKDIVENPSGEYAYTVLAFDPLNRIEGEGVNFKLSKNVSFIHYNSKLKLFGINSPIPSFFYQYRMIKEIIRKVNPDLVHAHYGSPMIAIGRGVASICTLHSYKKIARKSCSVFNNFLYELVIPSIINNIPRQFTVVSRFLQEVVSADSKKPVSIVYNPISKFYLENDASFNRAISRDLMSLEMVTCSLISPRKNIEALLNVVIDLLKKGANPKLTIIGPTEDVEYKEYLNEVIKSENIEDNVMFLGGLNHEKIVSIYNKSHVGLFLSKEETFGLVPLEMMAVNLPVIVSKVGVVLDLEEEFSSLGLVIVDPDDSALIADRVLDIDSDLCADIREFVKNRFSVDSITSQYESLYASNL